MKKIFSLAAVLSIVAFVGCEDVPAPYELYPEGGNGGNGGGTTGSSLPYTSTNLNTNWSVVTPKGTPWSLGNTYAKASGYNSSDKTTTETETWLISPAIDVTTTATAAHITLEHVIAYVKTDAPLTNHTAWISTDFAGDVATASWTQLGYKPVERTNTSSWDFYAADEIPVPADFLNKTVYVAFKFVCGTNSTTWELKNFNLLEGEASEASNGGGNTGGGGDTPTTGAGSKSEPYNVASAMAITTTSNAWVKGYIVGYVDGQALASGAKFEVPTEAQTEILIADDANCTDASKVMPIQLPAGDVRTGLELFAHPEYLKKEVLLYGSTEKYFGVMGLKSTSCAIIDGKTIGKDPEDTSATVIPGTASGEGTAASPYNVCKALTLIANNQMASTEVYVKGKICSIKEVDTGSYGNATYNISDDGTEVANGQLTVYRGYYLDGAKFTDANQIKVGDEVIVCGKLTLYGTTPEVAQGNKITSLNGTAGTGGGDNTGGGDSGNTGGGDSGNTGGGDPVSSITNGDFETWEGGLPTGWKSSSSASSATLSQSTDAHGGTYSVQVDGATGNKRLAYKETTFEAGTYNVKFYAKSLGGATSSYGPQTKAGYVPVDNGTVGSYVYASAYTNLSETEWTEVTYSFTLETTTTLCLVVMNPKNSGNMLVDDYTITKQ